MLEPKDDVSLMIPMAERKTLPGRSLSGNKYQKYVIIASTDTHCR